MSQTTQQPDMSNLIHRLKARLALANFKLEHGYQNLDLRTLESSLYDHNLKTDTTLPKSITAVQDRDKKRRKMLLSHHRFYPTSPPLQYNDMDRLIKKNASRSSANIPLSETRLQTYGNYNHRKLSSTLSSDDEDAAHLLVLMHQSPTMTS
ncbi:hypothetical protein BDF21DRAFT_495546 [Thamnidium elegans]|uniref:Uncharacterized protein n=1 Tax=Thamnidium elegans TaxID=101142 RepID=A0A8H7T0R9_9FUNG|nr:hypothetical protein INT48_002494 [Thamnidium elegans]KAI8071931.1 hypothetical protein BDF21DRAFT_495546 [Thamnidium elegans]